MASFFFQSLREAAKRRRSNLHFAEVDYFTPYGRSQ